MWHPLESGCEGGECEEWRLLWNQSPNGYKRVLGITRVRSSKYFGIDTVGNEMHMCWRCPKSTECRPHRGRHGDSRGSVPKQLAIASPMCLECWGMARVKAVKMCYQRNPERTARGECVAGPGSIFRQNGGWPDTVEQPEVAEIQVTRSPRREQWNSFVDRLEGSCEDGCRPYSWRQYRHTAKENGVSVGDVHIEPGKKLMRCNEGFRRRVEMWLYDDQPGERHQRLRFRATSTKTQASRAFVSCEVIASATCMSN